MAEPVTYASCALFGFRPDRDTGTYYRLLLNDLAEKKGDARLVVATNEPMGFDSSIELVHVPRIDSHRTRLWDTDDLSVEVTKRLAWHRRNKGLGQSQFPWMVGVYLAKTALMLELAQKYGKIVWLDAGLLFSVKYDHAVPDRWQGYDAALLSNQVQKLASERDICVMTTPRKWRPLKANRPSFHGLSYNDMGRLARQCGTEPDDKYVVAGAMILDATNAKHIENEFPAIWRVMLDQGRVGTEETVLSVMRWKHVWPSLTVDEWMAKLA